MDHSSWIVEIGKRLIAISNEPFSLYPLVTWTTKFTMNYDPSTMN